MRFAVLILALVAAPAVAQESVSLKWSLKEGDKFFAKNVTKMEMNVTAMGISNDINMKITNVSRYKVLSAKQDSTTVEMTILSMDMAAGGGGPAIPGLDMVGDRLKGAVLTAVMDENMSVTKLQGYDKFLDKVADGDEAMRKQMKQQLSEATMSQMFSQVFSFAPSKPVKVGETWSRSEKMTVSGMDAVVKMKYKLDSVSSDIAKLGLTGDMTFKAGAALPGLPEGVKVDKFDLKAEKFTGTMKFDTKAGRLSESITNADMNGTMSLAFAGNKIDVTMKIKLKAEVTLDDKNPIKD